MIGEHVRGGCLFDDHWTPNWGAFRLPNTSAARTLERGIDETLSYYAFPGSHWRKIRTNNTLERLNREIRRRTNVVGSFPDGQAALMLVAARLRYVLSHQWGTRKYMNMEPLHEAEIQQTAS